MRDLPGTYVLVMLARDPAVVTAGALGTLQVAEGAYLYAGSAFGPGGVRARVERHARADKRHRWHVDYLTAVAPVTEAWFTHDSRRQECDWLRALTALRGAREPWPGFGSSDCGCSSHLIHLRRAPVVGTFRRHLRRVLARPVPIEIHRFPGVPAAGPRPLSSSR